MKIDSDKLDSLAIKYNQNSDIKFRNYCMREFSPLIYIRANRYKQFSNYPDLVQEGFEALLLALRTFNPKKGVPFLGGLINILI